APGTKGGQKMTKRRAVFALLATAACASGVTRTLLAQSSPTRRHIETLASERLDGRLTGSPGERLAADYIISELERIGARPLPGLNDFRLPFEFTAGNRDGGSEARMRWVKDGMEGSITGSVRALSFSDNEVVEAPVVFAGYGIVVPDSQDFGYDSYAAL